MSHRWASFSDRSVWEGPEGGGGGIGVGVGQFQLGRIMSAELGQDAVLISNIVVADDFTSTTRESSGNIRLGFLDEKVEVSAVLLVMVLVVN